ncbi:MAG TPA: hypothetical protein PLI57_09905, partial [Spirochaetota bacterium]|nr:hypothetical protein [Spirochaetota bacterium]
TRIGDYAMVGMGTSITKDVLPFHLISGSSKGIKQTINFIGFSRNYRGSITSDDLVSFRNIIRKNKAIDEYSENMELREMIESFIKTTKRGVYFD